MPTLGGDSPLGSKRDLTRGRESEGDKGFVDISRRWVVFWGDGA